MELGDVLGAYCIYILDFGIYEYPAYSRFGWRTCDVLALGNDYRQGGFSKNNGVGANGGHDLVVGLNALWKWHGHRSLVLG